jgi:hypothetical protein
MSQYLDSKTLFHQPRVDQYGSHMVMTNVVKPNRTICLNIDTTFCDEYSNNYSSTGCNAQTASYNITLPERINGVKCISVVNAEIPMTFYNVSSALGNNAFQYSALVAGTRTITFSLVVPDGSYATPSDLVSQINSVLATQDLSGYKLQCALSGNKTRLSISSYSGGGSAPSITVSVNFSVDDTGSVDSYLVKEKLGWTLGFHNVNYTVATGGGTTSEGICFVNKPKYAYIAVDEHSKNSMNSFHTALPQYQINKNILAKVIFNPAVYGFGTVLPANIMNGSLFTDVRTYGTSGKADIQKLNVQLLDEQGNVMVLNGCDFSFGLQIELE